MEPEEGVKASNRQGQPRRSSDHVEQCSGDWRRPAWMPGEGRTVGEGGRRKERRHRAPEQREDDRQLSNGHDAWRR